MSNYAIDAVAEIEPRQVEEAESVEPQPQVAELDEAETQPEPDNEISQSQVLDQLTGQWRLFAGDDNEQ